ncbi:MAG: phage holin family protein [Oscillospiraceae bacterium]
MKFTEKYNLFLGGIITVLSSVFGVFWYLFALFLLFNILDWITGWYKSYTQHKESSKIGLIGLLKKLGYWIVIIVAFSIPLAFETLGKQIGIDLSFLQLLGWFTLASLMVNEVRSILENLVETGFHVPTILVKGLAITDKLINSKSKLEENKINE